jgi:hypothetical protein
MIVWNWNISLSDKGGQLQKAPEQALLVYHKFSLKSSLHNRGHILVAAQVVMFNGYIRDFDKYP